MTYDQLLKEIRNTNDSIKTIKDRKSLIIMYELNDKRYIINRSVEGDVHFKNLSCLFKYIGINSDYFYSKVIKSWYKTDTFTILDIVNLDNYNGRNQGILNEYKRYWADIKDAIVLRNDEDNINLHEMTFKNIIYSTVNNIMDQIIHYFKEYKSMYCNQHEELLVKLSRADTWFENIYEKGNLHSRWSIINNDRVSEEMKCIIIPLFDELLDRYEDNDSYNEYPVDLLSSYYTNNSLRMLYRLMNSFRIKNIHRDFYIINSDYNYWLNLYNEKERKSRLLIDRERERERQIELERIQREEARMRIKAADEFLAREREAMKKNKEERRRQARIYQQQAEERRILREKEAEDKRILEEQQGQIYINF